MKLLQIYFGQHLTMRTLSLLLVLLGLASFVYSETCPPKENLYPCTCQKADYGDILVFCDDHLLTLTKLKRALSSLSGKKNVDLLLNYIDLGTVPSNFFDGIGVKILEITHCELDSLSDDGRPCLLGLENTLEELTIVASFLEEKVPANLKVGHLKRLKKIELTQNYIRKLGDDWFEGGPASLEYLTISTNDIQEIGSRAFADLINLKELSIDGNRFGPIKRSILPNPAQKLEMLEWENNALTGLPEDIFTNMPALSDVSFRSNGILRLDQRTWQSVWSQLDVISLEGNPIECDPHMNWMFSLRKTSAIYGTCRYPKEFQGKSLQDFIDSRSE